jgi:glutathione S-transferase
VSSEYRIFGSELSPYSVKVRSWFRYKGIPHRWLLRAGENLAEYQRFAKIPIVPLVVTPEGTGLQDSTPLIEQLEATFPDPSIHPGDPVCAFVSTLLEEFGDEWGNKWMFHYRWAREIDQWSAAGRLARSMAPLADDAAFAERTRQVRDRMVDRVGFVGSNPDTAPLIEASFCDAIVQLDDHLARRPYLFGARPSFGDFGMWGQLYEAWTDPTAGALIEARALNLLAWIQRMLWPRAEGEFEAWEALAPTLMPFLTDQVGARFMPWTLANARAIAGGQQTFDVELPGGTWRQQPQKYHARSLAALQAKHRALAERSQVDPVLEAAGCLAGLTAAAA